MGYKVIVAPCVRRALIRANDYLVETFYSPSAAMNLMDAYDRAISALEANPLAYPLDFELSKSAQTEIRKIKVENHKMLYVADKASRCVYVISLIHDRRDAPSHFRKDWQGSGL